MDDLYREDEADFFVMLHCQNGSATVMTDDQGEVAFYETKEDADYAAFENMLGKAFGWEVFCMGNGE